MSVVTQAWALTAKQTDFLRRVESFTAEQIAPRASAFDRQETIPRSVFEHCGREGFFGANVARTHGGSEIDHLQIGLLHYAIGTACSSVRSILTVHGMVCEILQRWGSVAQRQRWLPRLASGECIAAFALTEAEAGSDAGAVEARAVETGGGYVLSGAKRWITGGLLADLFLVFVKHDGENTAFLLERATPGFEVAAMKGSLGLRGAMLASLSLTDCFVPPENRVGRQGFGIDAIASTGLDFGRFTVAWGCVGLAQASLDASFRWADRRKQFGKAIREHQLVSAMLSNMVVAVRASSLTAAHAAKLRDCRDESALMETIVAKYLASRACAQVASDAVQIHGASGCSAGHEVERWYRDAKIMEIIEGSTQIHQTLISRLAYELRNH